jgi:hypothetical protein
MVFFMGSNIEVFIVIRNLEVFGGQSYSSGDNLKGSSCPSYHIASCNVVLRFLLFYATFNP